MSLTITQQVTQILMHGDLSRLNAPIVAQSLNISETTLRRRLAAEGSGYKEILWKVRKERCAFATKMAIAQEGKMPPGKVLAEELGYIEINSFYRAFGEWMGMLYSEYKAKVASGEIS